MCGGALDGREKVRPGSGRETGLGHARSGHPFGASLTRIHALRDVRPSMGAKKTPRLSGVENAFQRRRSRCCRAMKLSLRWALIIRNPYRTHFTTVSAWVNGKSG